MFGRTFWQAVCLALVACGGSGSACGGSSSGTASSTGTGSSSEAPQEPIAVRRAFPADAEVTPFSNWSVPGVTLYRGSWSTHDSSSSRVVGLAESGEVLGGAELMRRVGELAPQDLAVRANAILLPFAWQELPAPGYSEWGSAQEQALIREARIEDGVLCYFAIQGEMNPGIVQRCVQLTDYSVTTRTAAELILAAGDNVVGEGERCIAHSQCGCWNGCVRVRPIQRPGNNTQAYQTVGSGELLERVEECLNGACFEVCRGPGDNAHCDAGTFETPNMACSEACPPSRADFHCETSADGCRQVSHDE